MSRPHSTGVKAPALAINRISARSQDVKDTASALFDEVIADRRLKDSPELGNGILSYNSTELHHPVMSTGTRRKFTVGAKRKRHPLPPAATAQISIPVISATKLENSPAFGKGSDPFNFSDEEPSVANERIQLKSPRKTVPTAFAKPGRPPTTRTAVVRPSTKRIIVTTAANRGDEADAPQLGRPTKSVAAKSTRMPGKFDIPGIANTDSEDEDDDGHEEELGFDSHMRGENRLEQKSVISSPPGRMSEPAPSVPIPPSPAKSDSGVDNYRLELFSSPPRLAKNESTDSQSSISASIQSVSLYSPQRRGKPPVQSNLDAFLHPPAVPPVVTKPAGKVVASAGNEADNLTAAPTANSTWTAVSSYTAKCNGRSTANISKPKCSSTEPFDARMELDDQSLISPARRRVKLSGGVSDSGNVSKIGFSDNTNNANSKTAGVTSACGSGGITRVTFRPHDSNVFDIAVGHRTTNSNKKLRPVVADSQSNNSVKMIFFGSTGESHTATSKDKVLSVPPTAGSHEPMETDFSAANNEVNSLTQTPQGEIKPPALPAAATTARFFKNSKMLNLLKNSTVVAAASNAGTATAGSAGLCGGKTLQNSDNISSKTPLPGADKPGINDNAFEFKLDSSEDEPESAVSDVPCGSVSTATNCGKKIFSSGKNKSNRPIYKHSWQLEEAGSDSQEPSSSAVPNAFQRSQSTSSLKNQQKQPTAAGIASDRHRRMLSSRSVSLIKSNKPVANRFGDEEGSVVSQLKVSRKAKSLFTVIRNVKQAHQCHEWGEVQEFKDEIVYILGSLTFTNPMNVRRLSALRLASQCLNPPFRAHIRINQIVAKIFRALSDAAKDCVLGLITSTILYILSRDRQGVTLDQRIVRLIVTLMQSSTTLDVQLADAGLEERAEYQEVLVKMWTLLCDWKRKVFESNSIGSSFQFDVKIENLAASYLATESLVFLCVQTPMEWFKTDMRNLGGLDYIANKFILVCDEIEMNSHLPDFECLVEDDLRTVQRYLRIIENCTFMFKPNQDYLISFSNHAVLLGCAKLLIHCQEMIASLWQSSVDHSLLPSTSSATVPLLLSASPNPANNGPSPPISPNFSSAASDSSSLCDNGLTRALFGCLTSNFKAIINLSHDNVLGCATLGRNDVFVSSLLNFILKGHKYAPMAVQFDMLLLALGSLINLVETCNANRVLLLEMKADYPADPQAACEEIPGIQALARLYVTHEKQVEALEVSLDLDQVVGQVDPGAVGNNNPGASAGTSATAGRGDEPTPGTSSEGSQGPGSVAPASGPLLGGSSSEPTPQQIRKMVCGALKTAGQHMEDSIVCAYCALVIGCVLRQNEDKAQLIRKEFKSNNFEHMVAMLNKFKDFMERTNSFNSSSARSIDKVIETLESLD